MNPKTLSHILCIALLLAGHLLVAQSNQIRAYTLRDGLPQSQVYDLVQDELGYLWLGTQGGGLCRFDGERFRIWNERDGLASNFIHALSIQADRLLIGTRSGLTVKTRKGFQSYAGPQINAIWGQGDTCYLGTQMGVYRYITDQGISRLELHKLIDKAAVNAIAWYDGAYWIATNRGLWKGKALSMGSFGAMLARGDMKSLAFHDEKIIAATFDKGLLTWEKGGKALRGHPQPRRINHLAYLNSNELWVSTDNTGIWRLDANTLNVISQIGTRNGLGVFHVRKCIEDRQGNIWIASSGGGLYKYARNNFRHFDKNNGLLGNRVYAVHADSTGLWASNSESGIVRIDSGKVVALQAAKSLQGVKIKCLTTDSLGNLWVGTDGKGIFVRGTRMQDSLVVDSLSEPIRVDTFQREVAFLHQLTAKSGLRSDWIRKIVMDPPYVWAATYSNGISRFRYDVLTDSLYNIRHFGGPEGMERVLVNDLALDELRGRIWYATRKGHLGYIRKNRVWHTGNVLNANIDISSLLLHRDTLFLGTAGKGIWWSALQDSVRFTQLMGEKELSSNNIFQLVVDGEGQMWAGSERGVDKIVRNTSNQIRDVYHFGRNDGFLGIETCLNAATRDHSGNLWFGTIYGLSQYLPSTRQDTTEKPQLAFEEIEVVYQPVDSIDINVWSAENKRLILEPLQRHLAFTYRTVDLNHPAEVQYRWRLDEGAWSPWTRQNAIHFARMEYGNHLFEAQARNKDWIESDVIDFRFFITQPLYERPWFRWMLLGMLLVLAALAGYAYVWRLNRKNAKARERLQLENQLLSLEQKALRLQMNPHFVFNVLNEIKAMGAQDSDQMNQTINTFATLLRGILNNSRQDYISLAQEIQTLRNYVEVELLMQANPFEYEIKVADEWDPEEVRIPPMLIQPFVENAIRHGIMPSKRPGKLEIAFWFTESTLHGAVTDNGVGIRQSQQNKSGSGHQSLALDVTRERITSIAGSDTLSVREIVSSDGKIAGTRVEFQLPLLTDY